MGTADLIARAQHEIAEDRRIAALCKQQHGRDALNQRADVTAELVAAIQLRDEQRRQFTSRLGYGDDVTEPAATLADMVDPIESAFMEQRDHWECPRLCELCGERLASTRCPECHGSGCHNAMCEASDAYCECENCAGVGWVHEGCTEHSYADLAVEVKSLYLVRAAVLCVAIKYEQSAAELPTPHGAVTEAFKTAARDIRAALFETQETS